jgi:IrrE N-terminal-like domain
VFDRAQARDPGEAHANGFAAAFLMPEAKLRAAVGTVGLTEAAFAALACDLKVSPSALAIRLSGLRLIDSGIWACWRPRPVWCLPVAGASVEGVSRVGVSRWVGLSVVVRGCGGSFSRRGWWRG